MHWLLLTLIILGILFGPGLWVRRIMERYSAPEDRYEGSGGELARHLLDRLGLNQVSVEKTEQGDHYDPRDKIVRLSTGNFDGHSLTAITVAAHEVGHALQDAQGYAPLRLRTHLVGITRHLERMGAAILMAAPFLGLLTRAPAITILMMVGGLMSLGASTLVHLITLPTELNASFSRALPILEKADILIAGDEPHARLLLKAAALTYVATSLMSLLNIARWWALVRR